MKFWETKNIGGELAGSIGDLGTFLPYVIGAITFAKLDTTSVLVMFGLMYIFTAWFYRMPMPVQPMKVIGAAIIVQGLTAGEIAASGILMGLILLIIAFTGIIDKLAKITPMSVTMGIQSGLGISLAILGIKMINNDWILGVVILLIMLVLMNNRLFPASIVALVVGTALAFGLHPELTFPSLHWGINLPHLILPSWHDYYRGFFQGCLPQFPLTLTNSVLVMTVLAHELFPDKSSRVSNKNLCLTLGIGNLIGSPLGMIPICHGSGGLAAHYRFGARTEYATALIGVVLLFTGIFLGISGLQLLQVIPQAVLGGMLFYSGLDLVKPIKGKDANELFVFTVVLILSVGVNPAVGFLTGVPLFFILKKGWITI
ncbi:MAG: sulfate permease [Firmicutes bacterium HGW-Firmicutes-15]|nr:MAG: sulfate permease [Firmicutes bacterium HGW-Firmicutes-15]